MELTLIFVQTADKRNRQQAADGKNKCNDNHGSKGLAHQGCMRGSIVSLVVSTHDYPNASQL